MFKWRMVKPSTADITAVIKISPDDCVQVWQLIISQPINESLARCQK